MESKFQYQLSQKAEADLDDIVSYIAIELLNPQAASDFVDKLQKVIDEACSFPESGSPVNNEFLSSTKVRKKLVGNYIMYYLPVMDEKMVYIVRIIYGKRNMDEILLQLDL
ncbi:MAG: type II toxin-antitoxin system RelE/ParE family toxin [Eubacteriales bacterium]|nr:type II toxin-antitoxin system RelE/ParE family toxin [Eubacteriales bacterium]